MQPTIKLIFETIGYTHIPCNNHAIICATHIAHFKEGSPTRCINKTLHRVDTEDIHLPENPNYIIRLLIRKGTRYLRTEDLQCPAADAQHARKLLLYLHTYCLTDQHPFRLRSTFQNAVQVSN